MTDLDWKSKLEAHDIRWVRFVWSDLANRIRGEAIHIDAIDSVASTGPAFTEGLMGLMLLWDHVPPESGLSPVGQVWARPDWSTLRLPPYLPGHAEVMTDFVTRDGEPWACSPRVFLKRMIERLAERGMEMAASFENEFHLVIRGEDGSILPCDHSNYACIEGLNAHRELLDELAETLIAQGISVQACHAEAGHGQVEMVIRHRDVLGAADQQLVFRETAREISARHGKTATFLPVVFEKFAGTGCHVHFSLTRDGENLIPDRETPHHLSETGRRFLSGVLHHLPALMGIVAPIKNSYRRLQPGMWNGTIQCWGYDNKEAPLRVPTSLAPPSPTNIELKTNDHAANPYLTLGAIIAAGLHGLDETLPLPDSVDVDPNQLTDEDLVMRGLSVLPRDLTTSLNLLEADATLMEAMGPALSKAYLGVKRHELQAQEGWPFDTEVDWLLTAF